MIGCDNLANRGKEFEKIVQKAIEELDDVCIIRLIDSYGYSSNPSDYIVYKSPNMYCLELKSHEHKSLPIKCISDNQISLMTKWNKLKGIHSIVIVWFVDCNVTKLFTINYINECITKGIKSIRYDDENGIEIPAKKKRKFFDYDFSKVF